MVRWQAVNLFDDLKNWTGGAGVLHTGLRPNIRARRRPHPWRRDSLANRRARLWRHQLASGEQSLAIDSIVSILRYLFGSNKIGDIHKNICGRG